MQKFTISKKAKNDLKDIGRYSLKNWGKQQRNKYLTNLDHRFHDLANEPEKGKDRDYIRENYQSYDEGKHVIYYKTIEGRIVIIRILHERMKPELYL